MACLQGGIRNAATDSTCPVAFEVTTTVTASVTLSLTGVGLSEPNEFKHRRCRVFVLARSSVPHCVTEVLPVNDGSALDGVTFADQTAPASRQLGTPSAVPCRPSVTGTRIPPML